MKIRISFSGRHYDHAPAFPNELELPDNTSLDDALVALAAKAPEHALAGSCLVVVCGKHVGTVANHRPHALRDGDELMILAPVAGG